MCGIRGKLGRRGWEYRATDTDTWQQCDGGTHLLTISKEESGSLTTADLFFQLTIKKTAAFTS